MGALIRSFEWAHTPLGPPDAWPRSLKTAVRIMLSSRQPIWIGWGSELTYLYNDPYRTIIGGKHPWALGRPTKEVWSEIWSDIGPMLATAMGGVEGTYVEEQLLIMERNGYPEETYYTFSYSPIPDDDGNPGGIICANTDDTARVIGERQLKLLRALAAETVDARTWSEACERSVQALSGDPQDITFSLLYILPPESDTMVLAGFHGLPAGHPAAARLAHEGAWPIATVLRDHQTRGIDLDQDCGEILIAAAWSCPTTKVALLSLPPSGESGRAGVLVVGLNPFRLFDESYRGFLELAAGQIAAAVANDDAYEKERRRVEALAELDRAKTAFFSNVSHEFRTPLTLTLGPLEDALRDDQLPPSARERIGLAHRNAARLLRLVNSLLDFSRTEAGRVRAIYRPTDLSRFSAEIASSFRSALEKAGLELVIACETLPQPVFVDHEMWEKVLLNLISNAFKFTHEGRIAVEVEPRRDGREVAIRVRDTGIGIPQNELPKLFERFRRVAGAQGRSFEGSGIGLALVHELVKLHGGEIGVESLVGVGTTFTISLPFGKLHLPPDQIGEDVEALNLPHALGYVEEASRWLPATSRGDSTLDDGVSPLPAATSPLDGRGKQVLLADDNADMREYVTRLLLGCGYSVDAVEDGQSALARARSRIPDLILTDVMMPKLDGFELLRAIRSEPATAGIPVVMLSARAGEEAKIEGLDAGADDYLTKPFAARELLARLRANIQTAEVRREASRAVLLSEQRFLMTQDRLSRALATGRVSVYDWRVKEDRLSVQGPLAEVFGVSLEDAARGLPLGAFLVGIHPDDRAATMSAIQRTLETGAPFEHEYRTHGTGDIRTVLSRGEIQTGPDETIFSGVLIDLTREKAAERAARESQTYLRELLNSAGEGFYAVDKDGLTTMVNSAFLDLLGFGREDEVVGRTLHDVIHHSHPDGSPYPKETCPIYRAARTGEPAHVDGEFFYRRDGRPLPVEYRAHPIWRDGALMGAICTFADVSERMASQKELRSKTTALEEQTHALQVMNRSASAVSGDLDLDRLVQTITDAAVEVTGAEFGAFFYNVDQDGERYTLYALSGAPAEAFSKFPMPRNTAVFEPTFSGAGVVRSDDITKDSRYGHSAPYHGMPKGHLPVRSYLAVPVRSRSGESLGGLFFGHSRPAVFQSLAEERVVALASQAAVAIDNARLFQAAERELKQRRKAEEDLQALNASLEDRVATEISSRTRAEEALRQAQKMEAIGQLTGGVAHDFNNLLTVIIGGLDTVRRSKPDDQVRRERAVDMALKGAQRAASLTSRLLAFSRRQPLEPKPLELNVVVRDMTDLLHRSLGEQIELEGVLSPRLWTVEADQSQLESAIINLAVNARDAMPDGGKLTIETANTMLDESYAAIDAEVVPGQYVVISVSDTGAGMSKDTLSHAFEPFFTTKEVGRGTGLGLSMVYGFVKQSGGHITIYSEEGHGTTVKLYFPRFKGETHPGETDPTLHIPKGSSGEVVLLVEDNDDVRSYSAMILNELGYGVLEAADADVALALLRTEQRIDMLFTDVVLPGKSGRVLADAALELRPEMKVLFTTGYSRNAIVHHGRLDAGVQLITKPFTFEQLAVRVRDVLDKP